MEGTRFQSRRRNRHFYSPKYRNRFWGPLSLIQWISGAFCPGCMKLTTHLHLVSGLRMNGHITLRPIRLHVGHWDKFTFFSEQGGMAACTEIIRLRTGDGTLVKRLASIGNRPDACGQALLATLRRPLKAKGSSSKYTY
jgi:hypothetical protein